MKTLLTWGIAFAFATVAGAQDELKTNQRNEGSGIWIAVVPPGHEIGIEPLAAHRKKQGWEVEVVKRDEVAKENAHVGHGL